MRLPPQSEFLNLPAPDYSENILIIGESTAAGVGASSTDTTFATNIHKYLNGRANLQNIGRNGLKAAQLQELFDSKINVLPEIISEVIILVGANDCFQITSPSVFKTALVRFITFLIAEKKTVFIIIAIIPPVHRFPSIKGPLQVFLRFHRYLLTEKLLEISAQFPQVKFKNHYRTYDNNFFASDGIHPSDLGYQILAADIQRHLKEVCE